MIPSQVNVKVASFLKSTISLIPIAYPIGSMYGIYANIGGILMVNVTIYGIHGSYGYWSSMIYQYAFCNYKGWFGSGMICPTVEQQIKQLVISAAAVEEW